MSEPRGNYIGGEWVPARSGAVFENRNPADARELVCCRRPRSTHEGRGLPWAVSPL